MSDHDFFFALETSGDPERDRMLDELARAVLGHVGFAALAADELTSVLSAALADRAANGERRCAVRFLARDGELQVVVAGDGSSEWRTTRPLPAA